MSRIKLLVVSVIFLTASLFVAARGFTAETIYPQNYLLEFHGSRLLTPLDDTTILTDGAPTITYTIISVYMTDLVVDVTSDKGLTVVVTPLPDTSNLATEGLPSDALSLAAGGGTARGIYSKISAPNAKVIVTKTEAGDTTSFQITVRGLQE